MLTKLREPFGKAGLIVAIVALIAALGGGAYAASGGLSGKQKKEVEKIAKKYAGKPGKNGAPGATGPAGAAGAKGETGAAGIGVAGANGKSVTVTEIEPGEPGCDELGGAELKAEGSSSGSEICNGANGSPWTVGGLPKGATETGTWTLSANPNMANEAGKVFVPISFSVPLAVAELGVNKAHFVGAFGEGSCEGNFAEPSAPEGELCVYEGELHHATAIRVETLEQGGNNAGMTGGVLAFDGIEEHAWGYGSWAVTGG